MSLKLKDFDRTIYIKDAQSLNSSYISKRCNLKKPIVLLKDKIYYYPDENIADHRVVERLSAEISLLNSYLNETPDSSDTNSLQTWMKTTICC